MSMLASKGLATAPGGAPRLLVLPPLMRRVPSPLRSSTGAFSHSLIRCSTCRSTMRRATDLRRSECGIEFEIFRQIGVYDVGIAPADQPVRFLDRIDRAAARAIAIGVVLEVRLEDRLQHDLGGGLNHPIPNRRDAERTFAAPRLRNGRPPHRIGPIRLRHEVLAQARQPRLHAPRLDLIEGRPVHPRRARVGAGELIGVA